MKRTLLTGFGPFRNVVDNPTQRLAQYFTVHGARGHNLTTHVFPVSYASVAQSLEALLGSDGGVRFDIILMMGVAGKAREWLVERFGVNADEPGSADIDGAIATGGPIIDGSPQKLECSLPVERITAALEREGIPAVPSDFAGGYMCNHLLYRALHRLQGVPGVKAGFVHIPPDPDTFARLPGAEPLPTFEMHVQALETVLRELA